MKKYFKRKSKTTTPTAGQHPRDLISNQVPSLEPTTSSPLYNSVTTSDSRSCQPKRILSTPRSSSTRPVPSTEDKNTSSLVPNHKLRTKPQSAPSRFDASRSSVHQPLVPQLSFAPTRMVNSDRRAPGSSSPSALPCKSPHVLGTATSYQKQQQKIKIKTADSAVTKQPRSSGFDTTIKGILDWSPLSSEGPSGPYDCFRLQNQSDPQLKDDSLIHSAWRDPTCRST